MIWDNLVFSFFFLALLYAIGTFISKKTKGVIIALIFVSFVYIAGYLTGDSNQDFCHSGIVYEMKNGERSFIDLFSVDPE